MEKRRDYRWPVSLLNRAIPLFAENGADFASDIGVPCELNEQAYRLYEIRPRKDKRGVDLICDVLPFGRLW